MIDLSSFYQEAPSQIRMYPCPACNEIISADASGCRFCNLPIDVHTAQRLLTESRRVTTAVAQANTFSLSTRVAVLLTGFAFFDLYLDQRLTASLVICSFIAFAFGGGWLRHNSSRVTHDTDYPAAIKKVKRTIAVWITVLLVQLGAFLILKRLT